MMKKNDPIIEANPEHYGKFVVIESFNDNTVVAYGDTWEEAKENAREKGYKIVGKSDSPQTGILLYSHAPCEKQMGITIIISGPMFEACETDPICPACKYRRKD